MNETLRAHVTRTGFNLSLSKGQIDALVGLALYGRIYDSYGARRGLVNRGLIVHDPTVLADFSLDQYRLTTAGRAVESLLREAGLWDEAVQRVAWMRPRVPAAQS